MAFFLSADQMQKLALVCIGAAWVHLFHFGLAHPEKKLNRFSFQWFLQKIYKVLEEVPSKKMLKEFVIVFLPFVTVKFIEINFDKNLNSVYILWPAIIVQLGWIIKKLLASK